MKHKILLFAGLMLVIVLIFSGCNLFDSGQPEDLEGLVETYTVQTQAAQQQIETIVASTLAAMPTAEEKAPEEAVVTEEAPAQEPTHTATATLLPTATPTLAPTATDMPTVGAVYAEVSVPTNCRTGPGKVFDKVSVLDVDKRVEVVARNASGTYWVVKNPVGAGTCWLWGQYATVTGASGQLPAWESPPTPTPPVSGVTLKVSVPTNCRVGPGLAYDKVSVLQPGKSVKVVARHASADFWVIENPAGTGTCWVWGEYATLSGSGADLPVWDVPPTPTPAAVTLKVSVDTNCRTGPGKPYDIVTIFRIGMTADVVGRNAAGTYWVIQNPAGSGQCWVWGKYATLTGPTSSLPIWDPPATPTPKP